jgi:hypothetical protein
MCCINGGRIKLPGTRNTIPGTGYTQPQTPPHVPAHCNAHLVSDTMDILEIESLEEAFSLEIAM